MSDEERDWRAKYREALTRLSAEEARANKLENVLRLLVGRLCLAAQGRDARLDKELARVSSAVRKHPEPEQLEELLAPLSQAVTRLDAGATAAPLPAVEHTEREATTLHLHERLAHLQRERLEFEDLLQQMTARLDEIETHLAGELAERGTVQDDTTKLDLLVTGEVEQIRLNVERASDLQELRKHVTGRLDTLASHVQDFRVREETRTKTYRERTQRMRTRIAALERESRNLHQNLKQEQQQAMIDSLTGIPNRAAYDDRVEQEFKRWKRFGRPVTILTWDVDGFKSINDAYGHKAGDKVLRIVGQQLVRHVRDTDFVARYGGDEFVMLLVGSAAQEARDVADKIRGEIAELGFHFHDRPVQVTVSCGITSFAGADGTDSAFDRADRALYQAKKNGRNCCVVE